MCRWEFTWFLIMPGVSVQDRKMKQEQTEAKVERMACLLMYVGLFALVGTRTSHSN